MSPGDVYENEMSLRPDDHSIDDQWPASDPALATFVDDLRVIGSGPAPEPRAGLVAVMRQGPSAPTLTPQGRKKMLVRTAVGSLAAKLALGAGVAAASMTAAGAAGVLPDPAQHAVASVVGATTPFVLPDPSVVPVQVSRDTPGSTSTTVAGATDDDSGDDATRTRAANHGACVSAVAKSDTGSEPHGKTVSSIARSDCGKPVAATPTTVVSSTTSTTVPGSTTTSTSVTTTSVPDDAGRGANRGPGNSNGNGNSGNANRGNSGNGNSGNGNSGRN